MRAAIHPTLGVGLAAVMVATAGGLLHWAGRTEVLAAPLVSDVASVDQAPSAPLEANVLRALEPVESPRQALASPAEAFLESYYGPEAAAVRQALEQEGLDLSASPAPAAPDEFDAMLPGWLLFKDVEREGWEDEMLAWPEPLTESWLQRRLGLLVELSADDLAAVDALADLYRPDIVASIDRYMDSLEVAMFNAYQAGEIRTSPFLAWPPQEQDGPPSFFSMVRAGQGWVARIELNKQLHPAAYEARGQVAEEIAKRDEDLRSSLLALRGVRDLDDE